MTALGIINLPLFMLAVFLLSVTPGPDTAYIIRRSVSQGRAAGLLSSLEASTGCYVYVLAVASELTVLLTASTVVFTVVRMIGAAYLIYLGGRILLAPPEHDDTTVEQMKTPAVKCAYPFKSLSMQGFLANVLNPKVVLLLLSFFPQFVDPPAAHKALAFPALGAVFIVTSTTWNSPVAWVVASITHRVAGKPEIKRWFGRVAGTVFIGLDARLTFTTR